MSTKQNLRNRLHSDNQTAKSGLRNSFTRQITTSTCERLSDSIPTKCIWQRSQVIPHRVRTTCLRCYDDDGTSTCWNKNQNSSGLSIVQVCVYAGLSLAGNPRTRDLVKIVGDFLQSLCFIHKIGCLQSGHVLSVVSTERVVCLYRV